MHHPSAPPPNLDDVFIISPENDKTYQVVVSLDGEVSITRRATEEEDYRWTAVHLDDKGYHLVSVSGLVLEYLQNQGEKVAAVKYQHSQHTVWHTSAENEIYTTSIEGDKKYLWIVGKHIYVTPDEHLGQIWLETPVKARDGFVAIQPPSTKDTSSWRWFGGAFLICLFIVMLYLVAGHGMFGTVYEYDYQSIVDGE